jgi:phosphoribosylamine--glycine ligase
VADGALAAVGEGLRVRHDIGKHDLLRERIDHMDELRG